MPDAMKDKIESLGELLRSIRQAHRFQQIEISKDAHISSAVVARFEKGERILPWDAFNNYVEALKLDRYEKNLLRNDFYDGCYRADIVRELDYRTENVF